MATSWQPLKSVWEEDNLSTDIDPEKASKNSCLFAVKSTFFILRPFADIRGFLRSFCGFFALDSFLKKMKKTENTAKKI